MDSPQYNKFLFGETYSILSFKPYYKWIVLNTVHKYVRKEADMGFKPYYKWIVLNTHYWHTNTLVLFKF